MSWDITTGRLRLGLVVGDTTQDPQITMAMHQALALVEQYCDRYFLYQEQVEEFINERYYVSLKRYPIDVIQVVTGSTFDDLDKIKGLMGVSAGKKISIKYKGGYDPDHLPADLELALWTVFDTTHGAIQGAAVTTGGIKSASLTGVGSVQFDVGGATTQSGGAMGGMIPAVASSILDLYRREYA